MCTFTYVHVHTSICWLFRFSSSSSFSKLSLAVVSVWRSFSKSWWLVASLSRSPLCMKKRQIDCQILFTQSKHCSNSLTCNWLTSSILLLRSLCNLLHSCSNFSPSSLASECFLTVLSKASCHYKREIYISTIYNLITVCVKHGCLQLSTNS